MAAIYKHGFPADKDRDEAAQEALIAIRESGDDGPLKGPAEVIETEDHKAAGEYLIVIITV